MVKNHNIEKKCEICNLSFETTRRTAKFCSTSCYSKKRKETNVLCICNNCKKDFWVSKYRYNLGLVKYCTIKCRNTSDDWINSNRIKNINQLHKVGLNKLELMGRDLLNNLNIKFTEQTLICDKFVVDVFIPEKNVVIQWDGDYWHGHPSTLKNGKPNELQRKNIEKDKRVNKQLIENGFKVLRIWQKDLVNNPNYVIEKVKETLI